MTASRPWMAWAVGLCLLLAVIGEAPHLRDDAWEDEAATLMLFASGTPLAAFQDYRLPNNHMLFSAALAAWWERGQSVEHARRLPGLVWLCSMALMVAAGRRVLGWPATAIAVGIWSGAALTADFALALRGYAFSWPSVLLLFACGPHWISDARRRDGLLCVLAGATAVMILPTNGMALACCLAYGLLRDARTHGAMRGAAWLRAFAAFALGCAGLLVYLPHRAAMAAHIQRGFSAWTSTEVLSHWWLASTAQLLPLLPLLAWGTWRALRAPRDDGARDALDLAAVLVVLPAGALLLSPVALVPRALVPLLPLWCLALGGLIAAVCAAAPLRRLASATACGALLVIAAFACGRLVPDCMGVRWRFPPGDTLCHPDYRHDYHPAAMLDAMAARFPGTTLLVSPREIFPFMFLQWNGAARAARFMDSGAWRLRRATQRPRWVVARSATAARRLVGEVTRDEPRAVTEVLRVGWLTVQRFSWP